MNLRPFGPEPNALPNCATPRKKTGANEGTRTPGLLITNQLLYRLSYIGISAKFIIANVPSFVQYFFQTATVFPCQSTDCMVYYQGMRASCPAEPPATWRRIEVVITGLTRNQFAFTGTRVRIPPSPPTTGCHQQPQKSSDPDQGFFVFTDKIFAAGLPEQQICNNTKHSQQNIDPNPNLFKIPCLYR